MPTCNYVCLQFFNIKKIESRFEINLLDVDMVLVFSASVYFCFCFFRRKAQQFETCNEIYLSAPKIVHTTKFSLHIDFSSSFLSLMHSIISVLLSRECMKIVRTVSGYEL